MKTLLFTPAIDDRYERGKIHSRIGLTDDAVAFKPYDDLFQTVIKQISIGNNVACVLIDEAQFLSKDQVEQLTRITDELNIPVLAYGLRTDFQGELFEGSQYLLGWADELCEIKTICHCGRKATMNMRIDEEGRAVKHGSQVKIGGNESYVSTCRQHFKRGQARAEDLELEFEEMA